MKKLLLFLTLVCFIFTGCSNKLAEKAIEQGKAAIASKEYNQALSSFQTALDEDKTNQEAKNLYDLVNTLLETQKAYEENKLSEALRLVDKLKADQGYALIKSDVEALEVQIAIKQTTQKTVDEDLSKIEKFILENTEKSFEEAKKLLDKMKTQTLTADQAKKMSELSSLLETEQIKLEEEKKKQEEVDKNLEQQQQEEKQEQEQKPGTSKKGITDKEAINIVKKKIAKEKGSFPSYLTVAVDHVEGNNYVIHCYEVVDNGPGDQHTATYNWYYVNKNTGAVSSMF